MTKTERKIYMQELNKEVFQITDEGIIFMDYLLTDFSTLIKYIDEDNCMLIFDSKESYNNLKQEISQYLREICSIELEEKVIKFIAEEWLQQVSIIDYISHD